MTQRDELFANTVVAGVVLNGGLELEPADSYFYAPYGWVHFFVINHTGHDLMFLDNTFGVRGFVYEASEAKWEEIDLGFTAGGPSPRCLRDGAGIGESLAGFPTDLMDTRGHEEVRLLVVGIATDTGEKYGAYADIRIVEGGTAVPTPTIMIITPFPEP